MLEKSVKHISFLDIETDFRSGKRPCGGLSGSLGLKIPLEMKEKRPESSKNMIRAFFEFYTERNCIQTGSESSVGYFSTKI